MNSSRITRLFPSKHQDAKYVLYWMQQSARVSFNHALLEAIHTANQHNLPLVVLFTLNFDYLDANLRHYTFMIEGLKEVSKHLEEQGITFIITHGEPLKTIPNYLKDAHTLVMDYGYLKIQKAWRRSVYGYIKQHDLSLGLIVVESDCIVPVKLAYDKLAYGAYALRPSIMKKIESFRDFSSLPDVVNKTPILTLKSITFEDIDQLIEASTIDKNVKPYHLFQGGYSKAVHHLKTFIADKIHDYDKRSDPSLGIQSYMSMYLHFGQISSVEIYEIVTIYLKDKRITLEQYHAFVEQLVVRRELAYNFVTYNTGYDAYETMTESWAYETMVVHKNDTRSYIYTKDELEQGLTHDVYFNAAVKEMIITGFMANYMRMYWAKKIIEWMPNYKEAYETIVYLNNKYFIDGRDANSYVNIAWCFGKMDRAFTERPIFGKLRYMNAKGLERKFNMASYLHKIDQLK